MSLPRNRNHRSGRATTETVREFFLSEEGYVDHALGPGSRASTGVRLDAERVRARGITKADQIVQRDDERNCAEHTKQVLRNEFIKKLKACCKEHKFDYDTHLRLFIASKGKASEYFTMQREYYHRREFTSKRTSHRNANPKLEESDPQCAKLLRGFDVPVYKFVCHPDIAWARPDTRMGATGYSTGGGVRLVYGRVAKTPTEKVQVQNAVRAALHNGNPEPEELPPRPWVPMDANVIEKLMPAVLAFDRCMTHEQGALRASRDLDNTLRRTYLQSEGHRHTRAPDKPRPEKRVRCVGEMPYQRLSERIVITPDSVVTEEANLQSEQYKSVAHFWHMLGIMASDGKYGASMDCLYHLIDVLQQSEAMVLNCDFQYESPNGRRHRTVDETVSFMSEPLRDLVGTINDAKHGKSCYDMAQDKHSRVYTVGRCEVVLYPYAAVLHCSSGCVDLCIPVLHKYYPKQYELFTAVLQNWHQALMSQNGGMAPEAISRRSAIDDDEAYGPGKRVVLLERPPRNQAHHHGHWPGETRWRVRRLRVGESDVEGGTLPDAGYPLVMELDIGIGWMLWTQQRFWMQTEQAPGAPWCLMPIDGDGCLRAVGWLEGDDLAPEMHDYAYLDMEGGMLSELTPLLDRMFV